MDRYPSSSLHHLHVSHSLDVLAGLFRYQAQSYLSMSCPEFFEDLSLDIHMNLGSVTGEPSAEENAPDIKGQISCHVANSRRNQDAIMNEAKKWILELEMMRDEIHLLAVKNAMLLDSLAMAGEGTGC